jgi:hypothetical protein
MAELFISTGLFMGIRSSYIKEAQASGGAFVESINHALIGIGIEPYLDPDRAPDVYSGHLFGRSELDHHSSRVLAEVASIGASSRQSPNLALIRDNPFRVGFVPANFPLPFPSGYKERIGGSPIEIWVGSLPQLLAELKLLAADLRIPLIHGDLADETAAAINAWLPLYAGDSTELSEDERTAWLAIYEGARLASEHKVALTFAG